MRATTRRLVGIPAVALGQRMGRRGVILGLAASIGAIAALMSPSSSAADKFSPYGGPLSEGEVLIMPAGLNSKDAADPLTESISLRFESVRFTYDEQDDQGKKGGAVEYTWSVSENAGKK